MRKRSVLRETLFSSGVSAIAKVLAFIRTSVTASIFGATGVTDAFYMASDIITLLSGVTNSLTTVIVPMRTKLSAEKGGKYAEQYTNALLCAMLLFSLCFGVLIFIFAHFFVNLFAPDFTKSAHDLTVIALRIFSPIIAVTTIVSLFSGILNAQEKYVPGQLTGIMLNLVSMIFPLILNKYFGIYAMIFGFLAGSVLQIAVLIPFFKGSYRLFFEFKWKKFPIKKTVLMCVPVFIGSFAFSINQAVNKALASSLQIGSVTALGYASQLIFFIQGVIIIPITTTLFTTLSILVTNNRNDEVKTQLNKACSILMLCLIPITAISMLYSEEIVKIVFMRGKFDESASILTSQAFLFYVIGQLPVGINLACTRLFYALQDTRTPLYVNLSSVVVNIILNLIFVNFFGIAGLTLSASAASLLSCVIIMYLLKRKLGPMGYKTILIDGLKMLSALLGIIVAAYLINNLLDAGAIFLRLVLVTIIGTSLYLIVLYFLKQPQIVYIFNSLVKQLRRQVS
ncbi:putative peptidoglycan lipid II flippase [Paenibacillus sp. V4I3]|uniref:murein biosynthesis integral membrane protein MurJ n=1 Tax=Paenibacillus sp. V4I3 TaxID=3042305 RepID=UPI00277DB217|nr:murein biosynthesis integral membrane protein MurJ [Paenibacillus sp. V4I3]MDQ0873157.1 putative peptidoglycan lipid II flippase [Paenibacillus sp. V4I3]